MDKKKFFTKKKIFILSGVVVALFLIVWFLFKLLYLEIFAIYVDGSSSAFKAISNKDDVIINQNIYKDKYFEGDGIKFLNVFGDCYLSYNEGNSFGYSCDKTQFNISKVNSFIASSKGNYSDYFNISLEHHKKVYNNFLNRHNIKTDDDLFEFLSNYKAKDLNILSSYNSIDDSYVVNDVMSEFYSFDNMKFYTISGDYSGYVIDSDSNYVFYLRDDDMYYRIYFNLKDSKLTKDDIYKVISSVVIG